jgi:DNA polymerase-3 subunit epsilon
MLPAKLAFVDIETTGMRSFYDRVIEIAILRVEENQITQTFHSLINPQTHLPPEITRMTGIQTHELENAPTFRQIKDDILEILNGCTFVAHNVRFDYSFIKNEFKREEITYSSKHFCTVRLSRALYPQFHHHNLDSIIQRFGFQIQNRHRAFDDARILVNFYTKILNDFPHDQIEKAINIALKKPSIPLKLQTNLNTIPEAPGVYIFYGKSQIPQLPIPAARGTRGTRDTRGTLPLYVGKSINLRERILSHFSSDLHSPLEMKISQQIESIETIETAGELGALILESQLIKELLPLYNKRSRLKKELIALKSKINNFGYQEVHLEPITSINVDIEKARGTRDTHGTLTEFLGFFQSRKQAKSFLAETAKQYSLCEKLLGLESSIGQTKTPCFGYRLNRCKGACIGKELPLIYNLRHTTAFSSTRLKPWPFPGQILIEETNNSKQEYFLINQWCYMGSIKIDNYGNKNEKIRQNSEFDLDVYKILRRYLSQPQNNKRIKTITPAQIRTIGI